MASNTSNGNSSTIAPSMSIPAANLAILPTISSTMTAPRPTDLIIDPIATGSILPGFGNPPAAGVPSSSTLLPNPASTSATAPPSIPPPATNQVQSSTSTPMQTAETTVKTSISIPSPAPVSSSQSTTPPPASSSAPPSAQSSPNPQTSSHSQIDTTSSSSLSVVGSTSSLSSSHSLSIYAIPTTSSVPLSSSTSPAAVIAPPTTQNGSSHGSSRNIGVIAAPVAVGAGLVPLLVLFFCWWKRRRSFRGQYHHGNRSNDTEMSNLSADARESSHEAKAAPDQRQVGASSVPEMPLTGPERAETKALPVESTFVPGILPGLAPRSPAGTSFVSPPPYRTNDGRADSPSVLMPDPIEPLDVTRSPNIAGSARRPVSARRQSASKRHASVSAEDVEWPLPSPFKDLSPKEDIPSVPPLEATEGRKSASPNAGPPSKIRPDRGEGMVGPSSSILAQSGAQRHSSPNPSERHLSTHSPFDDDNANVSESDYSVSIQDNHHRSSMLEMFEGRQINDDGISEMSVSSRSSNRKSHLNHRASDEISVVSSLDENDDVTRSNEARAGSRSLTALPDIDRSRKGRKVMSR